MSALAWRTAEGPLPESTGRLEGRTILVTGAAQGIGRAIAELFRAEGAIIAALDRDADKLSNLATPGLEPFICVVSDEEAVGRTIASAAALSGRLDGVVNAAGIHAQGSLGETAPAKFREALEINLTGPFLVCRAAAPHLLAAASATVVNVSSASALRMYPLETCKPICYMNRYGNDTSQTPHPEAVPCAIRG